MHIDCAKATSLCAEVHDSELVYGEDVYVGHDEPSLLFYDNDAGAGNNATYLVKLPKDPPTMPTQDGTGGTFNFQLHPAIWFGMALCDNESAPDQKSASGFAGEPVPPGTQSGAITSMNSSRPSSAHARASGSSSALSSSAIP